MLHHIGSTIRSSKAIPCLRVHVDPSQDGAEIVNGVADRMRREMYRNIDLENLLHPAVID
jgi:hypothetical protein